MLVRFCLYGFLKNQRYFEPFFMLALLAHELSFFAIGGLIACRSLTLNLLEIPSGFLADVWGRRRCMIASFVAYIVSFLTFAWTPHVWLLIPAMILYGLGDSFRTGTHKAMIFEWLRSQGREREKTRVYGQTRSWSKYGSAVSSVLSAICVLSTGDFRSVFLFATVPYAINIVNFMGYPSELDGQSEKSAKIGLGQLLGSFREALRVCLRNVGVRRLLGESMAWEGVYDAVHDYLQPALLLLALSLFAGRTWSEAAPSLATVSTAEAAGDTVVVLVIAGTYAILSLLSGLASRWSHHFAARAGSDDQAARLLWRINIATFSGLGLCDAMGLRSGVVLGFIGLAILQNVWRPILLSRFDDHTEPQWGATVLSLESQSKRLATLFLAPLVGLAVDLVAQRQYVGQLWPIAVVGVLAAIPMLFPAARFRRRAASHLDSVR